jgi:SAM-dependent methyltransferase
LFIVFCISVDPVRSPSAKITTEINYDDFHPRKVSEKSGAGAEMGLIVYRGRLSAVKLRYVGCVISLKVSPKEHFAPLRRFLVESGYTETAVCERLGLPHIERSLTLQPTPGAPHSAQDRLDLLAHLFLIGEFVTQRELETWLPAPALEAASVLGLIAPFPGRPGTWSATAALYPAYGFYLVSDRWSRPDAVPIENAMDVVFPAITENTRHFMETLPGEPCENFLDLCSGTGIAALAAASGYAHRAWSADITEASVLCAEFNRLLNGLDNVSVVKGDLYDAVDGLTFDRIAANPPYMPSIRPAAVFAYGGELGDQITRRLVANLPKYLRPGGRFYCITAGPDRVSENFEFRIRSWLEADSPEFDIFVFERRIFDPIYIANQQAARSRGGAEQVDEWKKMFEKYQVEEFFYGSVVIQRKRSPGRPVTVRRKKGTQLGTAEIEWLRAWETASIDPEMLRRILDARLLAASDFELHVTHRLKDQVLAPREYRLHTTYPFTVECPVQHWVAYLLPRCDGKTTARELLAWLKENQLVAATAPETEFADYLRVLISGGFLEMEGFRFPQR